MKQRAQVGMTTTGAFKIPLSKTLIFHSFNSYPYRFIYILLVELVEVKKKIREKKNERVNELQHF